MQQEQRKENTNPKKRPRKGRILKSFQYTFEPTDLFRLRGRVAGLELSPLGSHQHHQLGLRNLRKKMERNFKLNILEI